MANMAEVAATSIGADALLTRVGAYYHDLGKSIQPEYYIENMPPGEPSPHESLAPDESAQKIFAHCSEGVRIGEQARLPTPVLDFMHMHHGNGLLEYFYVKNEEQGNPKGLAERDFRYPGIPPQTKETAILAICDAVEAASRTLKDPDERAITNLVQRIVFGKLRLGQLDESGLTSSDLKALSNSLIDTLRSSLHVRIEYPWQREERAAAEREARRNESATQRVLIDARLDSTDVPRPPSVIPPDER
jgi:cyclic-di-AMP phosphodiesterase PgpH